MRQKKVERKRRMCYSCGCCTDGERQTLPHTAAAVRVTECVCVQPGANLRIISQSIDFSQMSRNVFQQFSAQLLFLQLCSFMFNFHFIQDLNKKWKNVRADVFVSIPPVCAHVMMLRQAQNNMDKSLGFINVCLFILAKKTKAYLQATVIPASEAHVLQCQDWDFSLVHVTYILYLQLTT